MKKKFIILLIGMLKSIYLVNKKNIIKDIVLDADKFIKKEIYLHLFLYKLSSFL